MYSEIKELNEAQKIELSNIDFGDLKVYTSYCPTVVYNPKTRHIHGTHSNVDYKIYESDSKTEVEPIFNDIIIGYMPDYAYTYKIGDSVVDYSSLQKIIDGKKQSCFALIMIPESEFIETGVVVYKDNIIRISPGGNVNYNGLDLSYPAMCSIRFISLYKIVES